LVSSNIQLCATLIDSPGARVLYSPNFAAISGEYLMDKPVNKGRPPFAWTMENLSTGVAETNVRGSSSSFTVSLPVLVMMASTLKLSTPPTVLGPGDNGRQIGSFRTLDWAYRTRRRTRMAKHKLQLMQEREMQEES